MLSSDGKVAQQGSYSELSQDPDGAFTKLMEWQMSGGETRGEPKVQKDEDSGAKETLSGYEDVMEGMSEDSDVEEDEVALQARRGDEAGPRTVLDKSQREAK